MYLLISRVMCILISMMNSSSLLSYLEELKFYKLFILSHSLMIKVMSCLMDRFLPIVNRTVYLHLQAIVMDAWRMF